ncbi:hypothetical protein JJJ17_09385 [Paracoccus caeni]|uniref:Uncharacterized protein n=1 Tax=Paracoccus caeni TaxID=657651 RepID=A0A934VYM1_9RHOB|nr:hypothetical protein [Paracoccus caeni]MBK4216137.1 hypothetical protein [Paracoccus caeni]
MARSAVVGRLRVGLSVDQKEFQRGMAEARTGIQRFSGEVNRRLGALGDLPGVRSLQDRLGGIGKNLGAAIATAAATATVALAGLSAAAINAAGEIQNLSRMANATPEEFQGWAAGARTVGIEQEKLSDILKDMNDRVGDFISTGGGPMKDFFEVVAPKVGVTADQFRKLSGPKALQLYVDTLEKANLNQQDMTFYMEAIASDSTLLLPLLRDGGKAMGEYAARAEELGAVMSNRTVKSLAGMKLALGEVGMVMRGVRNSLGAAFAPTATYTSPLRMYEEATTPIFILPGAQAEDGGTARPGRYDLGLVTDHRQAQYVAAIMGRRTRMQRSWSGVLPGQAFDLVALSVMQLDLPAPYLSRSGIYEVEMIHPGFDPIGLEGSAMRCPVSLRETSPAIYAWNPATDEQDVTIEAFDPDVKGVKPPENVTLLSDASTVMTSGDTTIARIRFSFDPSPSSSTLGYGWEYRQGSDPWQAGGSVESDVVDGAGKVFGYLAPVELGKPYQIRVWTIAPSGTSEQVVAGPITASAGAFLAPAPTPISAIGGTGQIAVTFRSPNNSHYRAMEIYVADVDNAGAAVLLLGPIYGSANAAVTEVHTGLGPGATRYYFARSIDRNGNPSTFSASISATTT